MTLTRGLEEVVVAVRTLEATEEICDQWRGQETEGVEHSRNKRHFAFAAVRPQDARYGMLRNLR